MRTLYSLLLVLLVAISVPAVISGCAGSGSPTSVMQNYITALQKKEYKKAWRFLSAKTQENIAGPDLDAGVESFRKKIENSLKDGAMAAQLMSSKAEKEQINGGRAVVTICYDAAGKSEAPSTYEAVLIKEQGAWKIRFQ